MKCLVQSQVGIRAVAPMPRQGLPSISSHEVHDYAMFTEPLYGASKMQTPPLGKAGTRLGVSQIAS